MSLDNDLVIEIIKQFMIVFPGGFVAGLIVGLFMKLSGYSIKKLFAIMKG